MRQSITTRYLGPTNSRGGRIKAIARKRDSLGKEMSVTCDYQHRGTEIEHTAAAKACAEKFGWSGLWVGGGNVDNDGYVYVYAGRNLADNPPGREDQDWFFVAPKSDAGEA